MRRGVSELLLDLFFPPLCPLCGEVTAERDGEGALAAFCPSCRKTIPYVREPRCLRCSRGIPDETERFCNDCARREKSFLRGVSLLEYDDRMQDAVAKIKYHNQRALIPPYAALLAERLGGELRAMGAECLVPVPLHPSRLRKRGFNQAECLAEEIGERTGIPVRTDLLLRPKKTAALKALTPEERVRNLQKAFEAPVPERPVRSVILVDDIYTTGSTMEASAACLKRAGTEKVFFVTLCIVPGP